MSDAALEALRRAFLTSGSPRDEVVWLHAARRAGVVPDGRLTAAAALGHAPAAEVIGATAPPPASDPAAIVAALAPVGQEACARAVLATLDADPAAYTDYRDGPRLRTFRGVVAGFLGGEREAAEVADAAEAFPPHERFGVRPTDGEEYDLQDWLRERPCRLAVLRLGAFAEGGVEPERWAETLTELWRGAGRRFDLRAVVATALVPWLLHGVDPLEAARREDRVTRDKDDGVETRARAARSRAATAELLAEARRPARPLASSPPSPPAEAAPAPPLADVVSDRLASCGCTLTGLAVIGAGLVTFGLGAARVHVMGGRGALAYALFALGTLLVMAGVVASLVELDRPRRGPPR